MWKTLILLLPICFIGCAGQALVEFGMNDEGLLDSTLGDLVMRVTEIAVPHQDGGYITVWTGAQDMTIPIGSTDYFSVTNGYETVEPGSYQHVRVTVENLQYVDLETIMLVDTSFQFNAAAFTQIVLEENDELQLLINVNSDAWFDTDSLKIRTGHLPFEGASLKVYFE
jgi:hypothetical protein